MENNMISNKKPISEQVLLQALQDIQYYCAEMHRLYSHPCPNCLMRNNNNDCGIIVNSNTDVIESPQEWILEEEHNPRLIFN